MSRRRELLVSVMSEPLATQRANRALSTGKPLSKFKTDARTARCQRVLQQPYLLLPVKDARRAGGSAPQRSTRCQALVREDCSGRHGDRRQDKTS